MKIMAATIGAMDQLAKMEPPSPHPGLFAAICYDKLSQKAAAVEA